MASKVPKFGAWQEGQGGENFTVYFDNARKKKGNGQMINPNDPEDNPDMFRQNGGAARDPPSQSRADPQGKPKKVPQFGAWEGGENVGYTAYFENARKTKNNGPAVTANEPQMNRDMHPRTPAQARPAVTKPEPQEARSKVPQFGDWEKGGEVAYTASFDNLKKKKHDPRNKEEPSNAPQLNQNMAPPKDAGAKVPQFGAWNGGENVAYTAYFDNARKTKTGGPGNPNEPQLNRDVGDRARHPTATKPRPELKEEAQLRNASKGSTSSMAGSESHLRQGKQNSGGGGKLQPRPAAARGQNTEKAATIPQFGVWNTDPSQAEGFTGAFTRAKVERTTPLNPNIPPSYKQQTQYSNQQQQKGCCSIL